MTSKAVKKQLKIIKKQLKAEENRNTITKHINTMSDIFKNQTDRDYFYINESVCSKKDVSKYCQKLDLVRQFIYDWETIRDR